MMWFSLETAFLNMVLATHTLIRGRKLTRLYKELNRHTHKVYLAQTIKNVSLIIEVSRNSQVNKEEVLESLANLIKAYAEKIREYEGEEILQKIKT